MKVSSFSDNPNHRKKDSIMLVPLGNSVKYAEIDEDDFYTAFTVINKAYGTSTEIRPCEFNWFLSNTGYPRTIKQVNGIRYYPQMHTLIMEKRPGFVIDHIDQCKLNNKRDNLHYVTATQNCFNRKSHIGSYSKYKGVSFCQVSKKYRASIKNNNVSHNLGRFINEVDAALAYDAALRTIWADAPDAAFNFKCASTAS